MTLTTTICNFHQLLSNSLTAKSPPPATSRLPHPSIRFVSSIIQNRASRNRSLIMSQSMAVIEKQKVVIHNKYGEKLVGILHETASREIVVLCHGFRSSKKHINMANIATALEKENISAFRFDFAGNGESEGCFQYGNYFREADDLRAVIKHFTEANRVVSAIVGHSKGGDVVLLYASKYHDVHAVVNLSGRYDLKKGIEERLGKDFLERIKKDGYIDVMDSSGDANYRVTEESLMDRLNTDMNSQCLMIENDCRVLTVHGSSDEIIPVEDAYEFAKIIPNHRLCIIEGADHCYTNHQAELAPSVSNFIVECIRGK